MKNPEPFRIFPRATAKQRRELLSQIKAVGLSNSVVVDEFGHVIDGHERRDICIELGIDWLNDANAPVIFTHQFIPRFLKPHWHYTDKKKAVILIFDGLRTDAWEELVKPVLEEQFDVTESHPASAILPSETHLSRKAISAGCMPIHFSSTTESKLLEAGLKTHLGLDVKFKVIVDDEDRESGISVRYESELIDMVIFSFTDKNLHNTKDALAMIYEHKVRAIVQEDVRSILRELPKDVQIFVTSDHGFAPITDDEFQVPDDKVMDNGDVKFRVGRLR